VGFELRELSPRDGCNALSLGDQAFAPLKSFLRKEAKKLHQEHLVVDSKAESVDFYLSKGFLPIGENSDGGNNTITMFIDLRRVISTVN